MSVRQGQAVNNPLVPQSEEGLRHQQKAPDASTERLLKLAGIVALKHAVPFQRFLEDEGDEERTAERAGD